MKSTFTLYLILLLSSCSSTIKKNSSIGTPVINGGDSIEKTQDKSTEQNNSQLKIGGKNILQGDLLSIKLEKKSITLSLSNIYKEPIYYDSQITFQKWNGNKWQKIPFIDTYIFVSMEYILLPQEIRTHPFPFSSFAAQITNGRYRVIKNYYFEDKKQKEAIKEFEVR